ncbi:MAG TPA: hypothetical protein VFC09_01705 [Candidatus Dormibacteraeota bacterium]|nr:hypothetical protein [Candidatus Dormibacteraeota bacterium]
MDPDSNDRNDRMILLLDPATRAIVAQCSGPAENGDCPNAGAGGVVPCAGRRIVPAYGTGIEGWHLTVVDTHRTSCPLATLLPDET